MKKVKTIFTILEVVGIVIAAVTIFVPSPEYIFPVAIGTIPLLLGLEGLFTDEVPTRINLIFKQKNKLAFYAMILTYFVIAFFLLKYGLSLWKHNGSH
jgi:hypothetical protein